MSANIDWKVKHFSDISIFAFFYIFRRALSVLFVIIVTYAASSIAYQKTVKPVLSEHSKIDKTMILMTNGSLMKVKSIAECFHWSIIKEMYWWVCIMLILILSIYFKS